MEWSCQQHDSLADGYRHRFCGRRRLALGRGHRLRCRLAPTPLDKNLRGLQVPIGRGQMKRRPTVRRPFVDVDAGQAEHEADDLALSLRGSRHER